MPQRITPNPLSLLRPATVTPTVSKTRPADTTTYAAGDVISESTSAGTIWTFPLARSVGLGGILQDAELVMSTAQALKLDSELWLFDTAPTSNLNDNAAFAPTDAEMKTLVTVLPLSSGLARVGSGNVSIEVNALARAIKCASATVNLFGVLVARNAYIPTSGEELTLRLKFIPD